MKLSKYTKLILFIGSGLITAAITTSIICALIAGKAGNYYVLMNYSKDFAVLSRQYAGLTALGCAVTEIILRSEKDNKTE
ncbi:MAG: hypothetical protein E7536_01370 [Ruminococcaceae bacterium]|nr:hypothetical protein [Oscillospiraceae bacterium]